MKIEFTYKNGQKKLMTRRFAEPLQKMGLGTISGEAKRPAPRPRVYKGPAETPAPEVPENEFSDVIAWAFENGHIQPEENATNDAVWAALDAEAQGVIMQEFEKSKAPPETETEAEKEKGPGEYKRRDMAAENSGKDEKKNQSKNKRV